MAVKGIILYDFMAVNGGAEKLTLTLLNHLPGTDLCAAYVNRTAFTTERRHRHAGGGPGAGALVCRALGHRSVSSHPQDRLPDRGAAIGLLARLENCLAIDLVVAWRLYFLTMLGRMDPDAPCTRFFHAPEWQALYSWYHQTTLLPDEPPTLQEATRWIAIKGGASRAAMPTVIPGWRCCGMACRSWTWPSRCI